MVEIRDYSLIDETLFEITKSVRPLYYLEPINEEKQKEKFLGGRIKNPQFLYRDLKYHLEEVERKLDSLSIPGDELGRIFQKKRRVLLLENEIIRNRGDEESVREGSAQIHGIPSNQLVDFANKSLRKIPKIEAKKVVSSKAIKEALERALANYGLRDWSVEFANKKLTSVYPAEKKITVCQNRKFTEVDSGRLIVHEIGVHILRAANGYRQPLKIFAIGLPGYLSTEEGLALYFEELTGWVDKEKMKDYAARVIAVDSVYQGLDFRETFGRLKSYDLSDNQAWDLAVRVYRGGGYIKDHIYFDGFLKIKEFAKKDGNFRLLYLGKIGIGHLPLVKKLLRKGLIKPAKYLPDFLDYGD